MTVLLNDFNDFSSSEFPYLTYYKSNLTFRKGVKQAVSTLAFNYKKLSLRQLFFLINSIHNNYMINNILIIRSNVS